VSLWFQHITCVIGFFVVTVVVLLASRRVRKPATFRSVELAIAAAGLLVSIAVNIWWLRPGNFSWQKSLPLQLCDVVGMIAPFAMLIQARPLLTLLHFWGFGLCSQWIFTPVTETGPDTADFWISFILHSSILGTAWFAYFASGYRPSWRDWRFAVITGVLYTLAMIPIDIALGSNYGYVGNSIPNGRTLVNVLGPWPLRVVWMTILGVLALTIVKLIGSVVQRFWDPLIGFRGNSA